MYHPLAPCPTCRRHVRVTEPSCPFCEAALAGRLQAGVGIAPGQRLGRTAAFAFGAALAVTGCGSTVTSVDAATVTDATGGTDTDRAVDGAPADNGGFAALYGAAGFVDAGPPDEGGFFTHYGLPVHPDAGTADAGPPDDGGQFALYGDPAPPDAG